MRRLAIVILVLCGLSAAAPADATTATPTLEVGVVISVRGQVQRHCVTLPPGATGLDALEATGVDVLVQRGPLGAAVCRVQSVGCTPPADECFCQCNNVRCNYWAYFYQDSGNWRYSGIGALGRKLQTGMVEGWLWSEGTDRTPASALPALSFAQLCQAGSTTPVATAGTADPLTLVGYLAFGATALALGGVALWQRRRRA